MRSILSIIKPCERGKGGAVATSPGGREERQKAMKELTSYNRAVGYLTKVFAMVNAEFFGGELEVPAITIQSTVRAFGHVTVQKVWADKEGRGAVRELNLGAEYVARPIENVVATLIHEACHIYAMQHGIKDTSNRGVYHNGNFRKIAEDHGIHVSQMGHYGWSATEPGERVLDFVLRNGLTDVQIARAGGLAVAPAAGGKEGDGTPDKPPRKPSSTRKYVCPVCGASFRATREIHATCDDCGVAFELEER